MVCWIEGGAGFFLFSVLLGGASSYRVDRGRHLASSTFAGVLNVELSLPIFPAGARGLYPLARGCRIRPALGMAPALMVCWIEGGAGFFRFSVLLGGASSYRVDRGRHLASSTFAGVLNVELSLPIFPAGARGLYPLARGCRIRPALGMAPALMVCWIEGGAGFFRFSVLLGGASSYRVDRGRHLASSTFAGVLNVELSLPIFPAGARGLYPLARGCRIRPALGMAPALMVCWIEGGAGFFRFSVLLGARRATGSIAAGTWRRRPSPGYSMSSSLSRFFRLALAVFIPWRGAAGFDRRSGWHPR